MRTGTCECVRRESGGSGCVCVCGAEGAGGGCACWEGGGVDLERSQKNKSFKKEAQKEKRTSRPAEHRSGTLTCKCKRKTRLGPDQTQRTISTQRTQPHIES